MRNAPGTWFLTCPNICHTFGGVDKTQDELLGTENEKQEL